MVRNLITLVTLLSTALCANSAFADGIYICKGEWVNHCKGMAPDVRWVDCDGSENTIAPQICAAENGTGVRSLVHIKTEQGNKCGYNLYEVFCQ